MTQKTVSFRPQPLLNPPGESQQLAVGLRDEELIRELVREQRTGQGYNFPHTLCLAKSLGVVEEVTKQDRGKMTDDLRKKRDVTKESVGTVNRIYYMSVLGMDATPTDKELNEVREVLGEWKRIKHYIGFVMLVKHLNQLGHNTEIDEMTARELKAYKPRGDGSVIASYYADLKSIGVEPPMTKSERQQMFQTLNEKRLDAYEALAKGTADINYIIMLDNMRTIFPNKEKQTSHELPPLKKIT